MPDLALLLEMLQAGVDDLFDPAEFRTPDIPHLVETPVDGIKPLIDRCEARVDAFKFRVDICEQEADENGIKEHRRSDDEVQLFVSQP